MRGRSGLCPFWGFPVAFFLYFGGAKLDFFHFFPVSQILVRVFFGGLLVVCGGMVLDLVPSLWGDIDLRVRAWMCPLCVH